jgi:hypothetical protein
MPVTPIYSLPYPADSDPVDVPGDMQLLADATENAIQAGSGGGGFKTTFLLMGA